MGLYACKLLRDGNIALKCVQSRGAGGGSGGGRCGEEGFQGSLRVGVSVEGWVVVLVVERAVRHHHSSIYGVCIINEAKRPVQWKLPAPYWISEA